MCLLRAFVVALRAKSRGARAVRITVLANDARPVVERHLEAISLAAKWAGLKLFRHNPISKNPRFAEAGDENLAQENEKPARFAPPPQSEGHLLDGIALSFFAVALGLLTPGRISPALFVSLKF